MDLGNFSVSLAVKDLATSLKFYEALGFKQIGGDASQNWLILQNPTSTIGLFQGMFKENLMTFNPGWTRTCETIEGFTDVREIQSALEAAGIAPSVRADDATKGPASCVITDPDGNSILIDQHVG